MKKSNFGLNLTLRAGISTANILFGLLFLIPLSGFAATLEVAPAAGGEGILQALDQAGAGGEVVLGPGTYIVHQPVILRQDGQTLRGAGPETILILADNANCPVIVATSMDKNKGPAHGLHISDLLVDGNRAHQQREIWRYLPNGALVSNNGVNVCGVEDGTIDRVICHSCRSGGLVTTGGTRRLTVRGFTAYDNQFDGLACYRTEDSHFSQLNLHDNLAAAISLDLDFNHNVIEGAVLTANDLGIFMRHSRNNVFTEVTISRSRHDGVFMAQAGDATPSGWLLWPDSECTGNSFNNLQVADCGGRAFQVNNDSCTNNSINGGQFLNNVQGGLSQPATKPVTVRDLTVLPEVP